MTRGEGLLREVNELETEFFKTSMAAFATDNSAESDALMIQFHELALSVVEKYKPIIGDVLAVEAFGIFQQLNEARFALVTGAVDLDNSVKHPMSHKDDDNVLRFGRKGEGKDG